MKNHSRRSSFLFLGVAAALFLAAVPAQAQLTGAVDRDLSQKPGTDSECAMAKNPANPLQLFAFCNTAGAGMLAVRSTDGGVTWIYPDPTDKTIVDGDPGQGPIACCDPTLAWDNFGNLFITYLGGGPFTVETILSTDGGATFTNLATFGGSNDQPTVAVGGNPETVWIVWDGGATLVARGALVTGLGQVGAFSALQSAAGTGACSFGDLAVSPTGVVVQVCGPNGGETGGNILVSIDPDGLGPMGFGATIVAANTLVGGFDFIPAQPSRSVDTESGLAYDTNPASPHFGRLYLIYTEEIGQESNDMDILLKFSDDNGATWTPPGTTDGARINDDATTRSQFNPKISMDDPASNFMVCWHDCRESAGNNAMREYCTAASSFTGATPTFLPNVAIGDGLSTPNGDGFDFGDFSGLDYFAAGGHPIWGDRSNSTGQNPDSSFDAQTDTVTGPVPVELMSIRIE